jgi:hypothetical protein
MSSDQLADTGPPGNEEPGAPTGAGPNQSGITTPTNHHLRSAATRQCRCNAPVERWRYADAWREGFRRSALDALRQAQSRIEDTDTWLTLAQLADRYDGGGR